MRYWPLVLLWILWCTLHSGMISLTVTNFLKKRLKRHYRFYRLFYNLVAIITLIPLVLYGNTLNGQILFSWEGLWGIPRVVLAGGVILLAFWGGKNYDMGQVTGIRQILSGKSDLSLSDTGNLNTSGIQQFTRHPWYLAALIFIWIHYKQMGVAIIIENLILSIYLVVGAVLEERKLLLVYKEHYRSYQKKVSMLIPFKYILSRTVPKKE